jgi:hypothetical protein
MKSPTQFDSLSAAYRLTTQTWQDIPGWRIEPNTSNQRVLKFNVSPYSTEGRLIWWGSNMPLPVSVPTLNDDYTITDTEIGLTGVVDCHAYGWVRVGAEWMQYAGVERGTVSVVLNLV